LPRRSAEDAAKTRQRILDAAQVLFTEHGFAGVSTTTISTAAGVTDGALFHHFGSKKALFSEIAVHLNTEIHKAIFKAGQNAADPIDAFRLGARKSLEVTMLPHNRRIVFVEGPVILGTEKWRQVDQQMGMRMIEAGLRAVAGEQELPSRILRPMAILALGTISEITYALIEEQEDVDAEQCLDLLVRSLKHWLENDVKTWQAEQAKLLK
jgi:AcrR family transcriptional regulator